MQHAVGRRPAIAAVLVALVLAGPASAAPSKSASWAAAEIRAVAGAGLMDATSVSSFRPDDPLTAQALENLALGLRARLVASQPLVSTTTDPTAAVAAPATTPTTTIATTTTTTTMTTSTASAMPAPRQAANPDAPVTMAQLDSRLVSTLGLARAAAEFASGARAAGLPVPGRFGTEVVARLLGLRFNHPAAQDSLELLPGDPATRAEAAYSAAQILGFSGWEIAGVQSLADSFSLPPLSDWQKRILATAVLHIGMPYIWGGTSDGAETVSGVSSRGGYDCSGFVWRVYKLQQYADEGDLASVLRGRTTYQMSGEVPRAKRIAFADLQPADVLFFGDRGPRSKPEGVGHMAIYLGNGWFIHSSEYGVALAQLSGWYRQQFAWARRPLAEAGLTG
jgi:cell wall-associated NlpC family hydrolase